MKRTFYLGLLVGVVCGSGAFLVREHYAPKTVEPAKRPENEWSLLPRDFTISMIYSDPHAMYVLDAPESISVHRVGEGIQIGHHAFAAKGVIPAAGDAKILLDTFRSPNSYKPPSACGFSPVALLRLTRGEHRLDLLVCFGCQGLAWVLDGKDNLGNIGFSNIGNDVFRSVLQRIFPGEEMYAP